MYLKSSSNKECHFLPMKKMDLDQNLLRLHGALSSFSVNTPDNEKLQLLLALFQNLDETAKTEMVFYLVLNTKMSLTDLLMNHEGFIMVNKDTRNLDFSALSYVIFNLNLVGNLSEIVSSSPAALTVEVLTGVFAYADSRIQIRGLQKVIIGLFEKILKISKDIHKEYSYFSKLWEFMNMFADMMWCSSSFQNEELLEEDMKNILETCLICVNLYQGSNPLSQNQTYELKILQEKLKPDELEAVEPPDCKTRFTKYVYKLLDLFNDIFNSCFKYDPVERLTAVCENAFALYEKLENSDIEPSNLSYLDEIKKRPETEFEEMTKTDISIIIERVSTTPIPEKWLRALINYPFLTTNEEAMNCLKKYIDCVDSKDLMTAVAIIHEHFKKDPVSNSLSDLYLACLGTMSWNDLFVQFENYFALEQRPDLENHTFDDELTAFFNKLLTRDLFVSSRIIIFCIRSPIKTIKKICEHALFNTGQLSSCTSDLKMLKPACLLKNFSSEVDPKLSIISSVLHEMIDNEGYGPIEKSRLINLLLRLQRKDILNVNIENFIFDMIRREHSLANYDRLEFALEILRSFIRAHSIRSNPVLVLAYFCKLLNWSSWSCSTFTTKLARVREILLWNIRSMLKTLKHFANDHKKVVDCIFTAKELLWLRNEVMKTGEINQIYFCELWHSYGCEMAVSSDLYIQLLLLINSKTRINSRIKFIVTRFRFQKLLTLRISFTAAFIQILPIISFRGWAILMKHVKSIIISWLDFQEEKSDIDVTLVLFRIFTMSLYSLAQDMNQNQNMTPCFLFCVRNFGEMIQEDFLIDRDLKYEVAVVFVEELLFLLNGIQDPQLRKETSILLSPVIFGIGDLAMKNTSGEGTRIRELENWYKKDFIRDSAIEPFIYE